MISSPSKTITRFNILDLARFTAVLLVFFAHFTDTFNVVYQIVPENLVLNKVFRYGHFALCVFFVISGYVVTMTSVNKGIKEFFVNRFSRLFPLFWVACVIGYMLPRVLNIQTYLPGSSIKMLLSNMTMLPFAFGYGLLNPIFWTLIIELFFYIFIGFIIVCKLWRFILPIIAVTLIYCFVYSKGGPESVIPRYTPFFLAGMLFHFIQVNFAARWKLYGLLAVSLICSLKGMKYLAAELRPAYQEPHAYYASVLGGLVILFFAGFLYMIEKRVNLPDHPIFRIMGDISYPMYLTHIYWLGLYWYLRNVVQPQILLLLIIGLIVGTSWLLNVLIEKPLGRILKQLLLRISLKPKLKTSNF